MSTRGKCRECATRRANEALTQIARHDGPWFDHWRKQMAASVGGVLLDERQDAA